MSLRVELVNHACVKLHAGPVVVLCDPWLSGTAFDDGWALLIPTPKSVDEVLDGVTHVWISHEHPDHFQPAFFAALGRRLNPPTVLFQRTRDRRVASFCAAKGLRVIELDDGVALALGAETRVLVGRHEFYDSYLAITHAGQTVLNLNDCAFDTPAKVAALRVAVPQVDLLLTQFSYAAWKGGRARRDYRALAARLKLDAVRTQVAGLAPREVVPFASFARFAHVDNAYMNDAVNDVAAAEATIVAAGATPVLLYPGDVHTVGATHDPRVARARFAVAYRAAAQAPLCPRGAGVPVDDLRERFHAYRTRMFAANDAWLVRLARAVPGLGAFHPVRLHLDDLGRTVSVSLVDGFEDVTGAGLAPHASMHSSCLAFVFDQLFGFDTLMVNGRFEADAAGFAAMTRGLALGSLNAMGLALRPSLVRDAWAVRLLLERLAVVVRRLG